MTRSRTRFFAAIVLIGALVAPGIASAQVENATGTNVQDGDNRSTTTQRGSGRSGDAVGGQVTGVVSSGRTSVDARNTSRDSSVESGDVEGTNNASSFVGQNSAPTIGVGTADITNAAAENLQEGDNNLTLSQTASLSTGDGVAGSVIGVVTAAGGSTSVVAANTSDNVDVSTGNADGTNDAAAFVGQNANECEAEADFFGSAECSAAAAVTADIESATAVNIQEGDNRLRSNQVLNATSGDGVAGQVIGAVSGGATSIDATNASTGVSVQTGDADALNDFAGFVGQNSSLCAAAAGSFSAATCTAGPLVTADITNAAAEEGNLQEGDNRITSAQSARAATGDGVGGQVIGAVTSAGGTASIVAANTSRDSDISTGDATADNSSALLAGQNVSACFTEAFDTATAACTAGPVLAADIDNVALALNVQEGDNRLSSSQSANATTGDGVGGQVIGAVSAGATSIDARNTSDGVDVETGNADATNGLAGIVGQNVSACFAGSSDTDSAATCDAGPSLETADITNVNEVGNVQEGDNRGTASQAANASSGDGVGGSVIGAVVSAGGSASIVAANATTNTDISTGDADAANDADFFVGQNVNLCEAGAGSGAAATCTATAPVGPGLVGTSDIDSVSAVNVQEGDNGLRANQSANASSGDGVGGQVIGVVSAGATSVDATNRTDDSSVQTGDSEAANALEAFVGLNFTSVTAVTVGAVTGDISGVSGIEGLANNVQEGDNGRTTNQAASASSGDAVAGQVTGVVTSAGGSASVVVANSSTGIDSESGQSTFTNDDIAFVGLNFTGGPLAVL